MSMPETCQIQLSNGLVAKISPQDYPVLKNYSWSHDGRGYAHAYESLTGKLIKMHRLIMTPPADKVIDHINHDPLDNRRENLRICDQSLNVLNHKKESGFCFDKSRKKYISYMKFKGISYHLGVHTNPDNARLAAIDARKTLLVLGESEFSRKFMERYEKNCLVCKVSMRVKSPKKVLCSMKCRNRYHRVDKFKAPYAPRS